MKNNVSTRMISLALNALLLPFFSFIVPEAQDSAAACRETYELAVRLETNNVREAINKYFHIWNSCDDVILVDHSYVNACRLAKQYNSSTHFPDRCDLYGQGVVNVDFLIGHLYWLRDLDSIGTTKLGKSIRKLRMETAMANLADAIEKRGLRPANCIDEEDLDYTQLFDEFKNCDAKYFTRASLDTWMRLITQYQAEHQWTSRTWSEWVTYSEANPIQGENYWLELHIKLEEWLETEHGKELGQTAKQMYNTRLNAIKQALE